MKMTIPYLRPFSNVGRGIQWAMIPPVVGILQSLLTQWTYAVAVGDLSFLQAWNSLVYVWFSDADKVNMLFWHGIVPYIPLATAMLFLASTSIPTRKLTCLLVGGLIGIFLIVFPMDRAVWLSYFNHHGLIKAMIWIALPFIGWGMSVLGFGSGWLVSRLIQ